MWLKNIISVPIDRYSRCIYDAPTVLYKALDLEFRPIAMNVDDVCNQGVLRHWHNGAYEFNDITLYEDVSFLDLAQHYTRAQQLMNIETTPVIMVNNVLVDGAHRLLAKKLSGQQRINAILFTQHTFLYVLSQINPLYERLPIMQKQDPNLILAINVNTKQVDMRPVDDIPTGWITDIPDIHLLPYVKYVDGKWIPDKESLLTALQECLRLRCRVDVKQPIVYKGIEFYFGKYELLAMLSELSVANDSDKIQIPNYKDELVELSKDQLTELLVLHNDRRKKLCMEMTDIMNHARSLNDSDLMQYCTEIFNKYSGD